jgi:ribokinase
MAAEGSNQTSLIVIGGLHTDIIARGMKRFPRPGELVRGRELVIGPGGKPRNIAAMAGHLLPEGRVAMIGRTTKDGFGLWRPPVEALEAAGVSTEFVRIVPFAEAGKMPAIALIPVDEQGRSEIMLLPGVSDDFSPDDVDAADELFAAASANHGFLAVTMECPLETTRHAIRKAVALDIKVVLDPGGLEPDMQVADLLRGGAYLVKPNEHEARMLTGVEVTDFASAGAAVRKLRAFGVQNVLITHGEQGAYLFTQSGESHIPAPHIIAGSVRDATGCGDQTMAALCAYLRMGKSLEEAAQVAVLAGTLQFYKSGIQPITLTEIEAQL